MATSAFFSEIGAMGAEIARELATELGVTLNFQHRGGASVSVSAFLKGTNVTPELLARVMTASERIEFFIPAQTGFPPTDGIAEFDEIGWTPPITGVEIFLTAEDFKDISSFGTMFSLTCYHSTPMQAGAVG